MLYLGWIVAAFLAGIVLMLLLARHRLSLRECMETFGTFRGMRCDEVMERLERVPRRTERQENGCTLREWRENAYSVTLLFDRADICLGVFDERFGQRPGQKSICCKN